MKRATAIAGLLAALVMSSSADAAILDARCSPTGDYCTAIKDKGGPIRLIIVGFPFEGSYKLCVDPPRLRKDCDKFRFKGGRVPKGDVSLGGNFPHKPHGRYKVSWYWNGSKVGPTLHFNR